MIFAENPKEFLSWALFICFWMNAGSHEATHLLSAVSCRGRAECRVRDRHGDKVRRDHLFSVQSKITVNPSLAKC